MITNSKEEDGHVASVGSADSSSSSQLKEGVKVDLPNSPFNNLLEQRYTV